jgi:hypothetical protein
LANFAESGLLQLAELEAFWVVLGWTDLMSVMLSLADSLLE